MLDRLNRPQWMNSYLGTSGYANLTPQALAYMTEHMGSGRQAVGECRLGRESKYDEDI